MLIRYLYKFAKPEELHVANVLRILDKLSYAPEIVEKFFVRTADDKFLNDYKAAIAMPEKTWLSILVTLRVALRLWQDPNVCATTSSNTIKFDALFEGTRPCAVFVTTPISDLNYTRPCTALLFSSLYNFILSRKLKPTDRSIFILLDEFALYTFPEFVTTISSIRSKRCGLVLSMQDELALTARYGQVNGHMIKTNLGTKVYFPNQPLHTAKELNQILGKWSYDTGKGEKVREVATPSEIRMSDKSIILIKNAPPMRATMVPYFNNIWMRHLVGKQPFETLNKVITSPALIQFE